MLSYLELSSQVSIVEQPKGRGSNNFANAAPMMLKKTHSFIGCHYMLLLRLSCCLTRGFCVATLKMGHLGLHSLSCANRSHRIHARVTCVHGSHYSTLIFTLAAMHAHTPQPVEVASSITYNSHGHCDKLHHEHCRPLMHALLKAVCQRKMFPNTQAYFANHNSVQTAHMHLHRYRAEFISAHCNTCRQSPDLHTLQS